MFVCLFLLIICFFFVSLFLSFLFVSFLKVKGLTADEGELTIEPFPLIVESELFVELFVEVVMEDLIGLKSGVLLELETEHLLELALLSELDLEGVI